MGVTIAAMKVPSANPNVVNAIISIQSDSQLLDPSSFLFANFATVLNKLALPSNYVIVDLILTQITNPAPLAFVYAFRTAFVLRGSAASIPYFGPPGPPGATGPRGPTSGLVGPPGPTGPQGATGTGGGGGGGTDAHSIWGIPINPTAPNTEGEVPAYDPATNEYYIRQLTLDDILPAFTPTLAINSGGTGPFELGQTWTPTFNATPATDDPSVAGTCTVQDNFGHMNAVNAANPIGPPTGSGGSYTIDVQTSVNVTVTETKDSYTKTTNAVSAPWDPRSYGGVGAPGATSATPTGGVPPNEFYAMLSTGDVLMFNGLFGSVVGVGFGPFSPTVQKIYLVLPHVGYQRTFKDQNGFGFPMLTSTPIIFTNQFGVNVPLDIYESVTALSTVTPYTIYPQS